MLNCHWENVWGERERREMGKMKTWQYITASATSPFKRGGGGLGGWTLSICSGAPCDLFFTLRRLQCVCVPVLSSETQHNIYDEMHWDRLSFPCLIGYLHLWHECDSASFPIYCCLCAWIQIHRLIDMSDIHFSYSYIISGNQQY